MKFLRQISKMMFALALLTAFAPPSLFACAACYGRSDSSQAVGMNWGIFTLLGIIVTVLVTFAGFFIYLVRRQNAFARAAEAMTEHNLSEAKV
jgi:hypothetical protein